LWTDLTNARKSAGAGGALIEARNLMLGWIELSTDGEKMWLEVERR
jgi:hypothetical protein